MLSGGKCVLLREVVSLVQGLSGVGVPFTMCTMYTMYTVP